MHSQWIQSAIKHHGALRKALGVAEGENIPEEKLRAAARGGGLMAKRARLAMTLRDMHAAKEDPTEPDIDAGPEAPAGGDMSRGMSQFR